MSEMNTPKDSRTGLSERLDGILLKDPTNALASALKETLSKLSAAQAEQILNRLNNELPTSKGEEITHAPQVARVANSIEALTDKELDVRRAAAEAPLSPQVERWIRTLKESPDSQFRKEAASNLGERKDPRAVPQLIEALKDDWEPDVRPTAAWALGEIGDKSAITPLKKRLAREWDSDAQASLTFAIQKLERN